MASENPLKDYFEKKAGFGQELGHAAGEAFSAKNMAKGVVGAGAGALAAGAIAGIGAGAHALHDAITKSRDFKSMLQENPDLQQMHTEDPRSVNRAFSTLRTFVPEFTRDPMVAGAYLRQMVDSPNGMNGLIANALDARRKIGNGTPSGVGHEMMAGAKRGIGGSAKSHG